MFLKTVIDNCGDSDVVTCHNKKVDPALKFYSQIPRMINSNIDIDEGRANGTLCRGIGVKLKGNAQVRKNNWDGKIINTVSVDDVEYILCEHDANALVQNKQFKISLTGWRWYSYGYS